MRFSHIAYTVVVLPLIIAVALMACTERGTLMVSGNGAGGPPSAAVPTATPASPSSPSQPVVTSNPSGVYSQRLYSKPTEQELTQRLSALEYEVTQHAATEPPFQNKFWDQHAKGLYVDAASGEPLFSSIHKFDSGTGWPSFTQPVEPTRVVTRVDRSHGQERTEARSKGADSHLGHVFDDGPPPVGIRYCINSAALRFIPEAELEARGYAEYRALFSSPAPAAVAAPGTTNACVTPAPGEKPGCQASLEVAILAGGCFWGMEDILRTIPGVINTEAGYTGGTTPNPKYEDLHDGATGHAESVRIIFDPSKLSYADLLEKWFFRMHDPTTKNRQGNDVGTQYRSAIFFTSPEQHSVAEQVKQRVGASGKWRAPVVTEIVPALPFTLAEDEHQDYLQKHPGGYTCHYLRDPI